MTYWPVETEVSRTFNFLFIDANLRVYMKSLKTCTVHALLTSDMVARQ